MEDYRQIIAKNICELRKINKLTQAELAEKLHYSDKAISRWERGDTLPTVDVLCQLCELFGVDLRYLISKEPPKEKEKYFNKTAIGNKLTIGLLAGSLIWLIATCIYVYSGITSNINLWIIFVWAVPATALLADIFNVIWGKKKYSIITRSIFVWTLITTFYIQFLEYNTWLIFLIGIPMQVCIILWAKLK